MYTILQQGEQDSTFYTVQVNGQDLDHFCTLEAACLAVEQLKQPVEATPAMGMTRWHKGDVA